MNTPQAMPTLMIRPATAMHLAAPMNLDEAFSTRPVACRAETPYTACTVRTRLMVWRMGNTTVPANRTVPTRAATVIVAAGFLFK